MVEHAAVNRVVVGSSPTSGAIFTVENGGFKVPDTDATQESPQSSQADVKWPYKVRRRKNGPVLAKIYRPCKGQDSYRVAWRAAGKRMMKAFPRFAGNGGAKEFAEGMVKEITNGSQVPLLTPKQAQDSLTIRDMLDGYHTDTGRRISPVEAVAGFIAAAKLLPANSSPVEAARVHARTLDCVKPKLISTAISEFVESRRAKPKPGERARLSPVYARNIESWLTKFGEAFPAHQVSDLTPDMLALHLSGFKELSEKARNDRRSAIGMWLRWCGRREYIEKTQVAQLLDDDAMRMEKLQSGRITFYTPGELRKILDATRDAMNEACNAANRDAHCAVTALQAFGGARLEEALRLRWEDLYRTPGHIEISGQFAKTRKRRLLVVGPVLKQWLAPFKSRTGPIWSAPVNSFITEWARLRESVGVPSKRNGVRHSFVTFSYILRGEIETAALAGTSPQILHQHYRGLGRKPEARAWFGVRPAKTANNIVPLRQKGATA